MDFSNLFTKRKIFYFFTFLLLILFLLSCSSYPSNEDGKKLLENKYKNLVRVVNFKETNALKGELAGIKFYEMEYEAEFEYLEDVAVERFMGDISVKKGKKGPSEFLSKEIKKGSREVLKGKLLFEEAKNGWRGK